MTDLQLWQQLKLGDKTALESIYRTHVSSLLAYGGRFTADTAMIEDAVQDVFINIWNNKTQLSDTDRILPYLYTSLRRNILLKLKQKLKTNATEEIQDHLFPAAEALEQSWIAGETATENAQRLKSAINGLSERQREVLYLRYYVGMDYEDITEVMDINYQSVRNLVAKGIKTLRMVLSTALFLFFYVLK